MKQIVENQPEGLFLDYKWNFYDLKTPREKGELSKDIMAFANHPSSDDKFIIFGVKEVNGYPTGFQNVDINIDDSVIQQIVHSYTEPKLNFEISKTTYEKFNLAYIRIFKNENRPYLFKKQICDFKIGDALMRHGTSTRRLDRSDYDEIYLFKNKPIDRKSDIKVKPIIGKSENDLIIPFQLRCVDFSLENTSNQSLEIEFQMKVYKSPQISFFSEDELVKKSEELSRPNSFLRSITSFHPSRFDINIEDYKEFIVISRFANPKISLSQKEKFKFIFGKYLFFDVNSDHTICEITIELQIRSDSFHEGPLIENYVISVES